MRVQFDPGTEKYLPFAKRKLTELSALRAKFDLPVLTKALSPEPGTIVWLKSSVFGDWIYMTGSSGYYFATLLTCGCECDGDQDDIVVRDYLTAVASGQNLTITGSVASAQTYNCELVWMSDVLDMSYIKTVVEETVVDPGSPAIPGSTITVYGGMVDVPTIGTFSVPGSSPPDYNGLNAAGTEYYTWTDDGQVFATTTPAEIDAIFSVSGTTFTPDLGVSYSMPSGGGTPAVPATTTVTSTTTEDYTNWYEPTPRLRNGTRTTVVVTVDGVPGSPDITDDTSTQTIVTAFVAYPDPAANTCSTPVPNVSIPAASSPYTFTGTWRGSTIHTGTRVTTAIPFVSTTEVFSGYSVQVVDKTSPATGLAIGYYYGSDLKASTTTPRIAAPFTTFGTLATAAALVDDELYLVARTGTWFFPNAGPNTDTSTIEFLSFGYKAYVVEYAAAAAAACAENAAARLEASLSTDDLEASLSTDDLARSTFWTASSALLPGTEGMAELKVDTYAIEYRQASDGEWSSFPVGAVNRARVATGRTEKVVPVPDEPHSPAAATKFAGKEVAVTTAPVTLVYIAKEPVLNDDTATQRGAFLAQVESAGGVDSLSDANRIKSMFFQISEALRSVL